MDRSNHIWAVIILSFGVGLGRTDGVRLIPETNGVCPGSPAFFAIEITFPEGWHTYWLNPGEAGAPPRFLWRITPSGPFPVLAFPSPERFDNEGIVTYGHSSPLRILATWMPPPELKPSSKVSIHLKAEWLICREVCEVREGVADLSWPVQASQPQPLSEHIPLFRSLRGSLPVRDPGWRFILVETDQHWTLHARLPTGLSLPPPSGILFFSRHPGVVSTLPPVVSHSLAEGWAFQMPKGPVALPAGDLFEGNLQISNWTTSLWVTVRTRSTDGAPEEKQGAEIEEKTR